MLIPDAIGSGVEADDRQLCVVNWRMSVWRGSIQGKGIAV
jgi:hypothetical protein